MPATSTLTNLLRGDDFNGNSTEATDTGPGGSELSIDTLPTDGSLRLTFDAATTVLDVHYDENRNIGGYTRTQFYTADVDVSGIRA